MQERRLPIPEWGRSSGEGNGNHSSTPAWETPWTEEPGGDRPWGHRGVGHDLVTKQQQRYPAPPPKNCNRTLRGTGGGRRRTKPQSRRFHQLHYPCKNILKTKKDKQWPHTVLFKKNEWEEFQTWCLLGILKTKIKENSYTNLDTKIIFWSCSKSNKNHPDFS